MAYCNDQTLKSTCWPKGGKDLYLVLFYELSLPNRYKSKDSIAKHIVESCEHVKMSPGKHTLEDPCGESLQSKKATDCNSTKGCFL